MAEALREVFIHDWICGQEVGTSKRRIECKETIQMRQNNETRPAADESNVQVLILIKRTLVILSFLKIECIEARAVYVN